MNQILALREKRANLWNQTKAFLDSHRGEDGMVSAEDNATYEKMEADVVALGKEIERLERQAAIDREMDQPTAAPLVSRPTTATAQKQGRASDEYRNAFWGMIRNRSASPAVMNALQIGTDSEGGYLVHNRFRCDEAHSVYRYRIYRFRADSNQQLYLLGHRLFAGQHRIRLFRHGGSDGVHQGYAERLYADACRRGTDDDGSHH